MSGRHRANGGAALRRGRWGYLLVPVVVVALAFFGVRWVNGIIDGCANPVEVVVDAAPSIAGALTEFAEQELSALDGEARCVRPEIRASSPASVANQLSGDERADRPAVWIPDSTLWLHRAHTVTESVPDKGHSIATSPVVLATTERTARSAGWPDRPPTWAELLTGSGIAGTPDPSGDTSVMLTLSGIDNLDITETERTRALQALTKRTFAEGANPFQHLPDKEGEPTVALFPSSEQAVLQHNDGTDHGTETAVVAAYPELAVAWLDYPAAVLEGLDGATHNAAQVLVKALRGEQARASLAGHGFRTPEGKLTGQAAADKRANANYDRLTSAPEGRIVDEVLQRWATLSSAARMVVALDVSGSMNEPVDDAGATRMQIAIETVGEAMRLLRANTQLSFWEFSTRRDGELPYKELAPWKPMLQHMADNLPEKLGEKITGPAGNTGLYDTTLAAYREVQRGWDPALLNMVLIVTDGKNHYPDGLTRNELVNELTKIVDTARPIGLVFVGFGTDVDPKELEEIAAAAGGQVHVTPEVHDVRELFFTVLRKMSCPDGDC